MEQNYNFSSRNLFRRKHGRKNPVKSVPVQVPPKAPETPKSKDGLVSLIPFKARALSEIKAYADPETKTYTPNLSIKKGDKFVVVSARPLLNGNASKTVLVTNLTTEYNGEKRAVIFFVDNKGNTIGTFRTSLHNIQDETPIPSSIIIDESYAKSYAEGYGWKSKEQAEQQKHMDFNGYSQLTGDENEFSQLTGE
jgi:hypothetical protein